MNIQIFGKSKCFDTKKAERYFKEHRIPFQLIDLTKYGISKGEFNKVYQAIHDLDLLIDTEAKDKTLLALLNYLSIEDKIEKLLENPKLLKTPIVRNSNQATIGYHPEIWQSWS